jgi:hypothetical protein
MQKKTEKTRREVAAGTALAPPPEESALRARFFLPWEALPKKRCLELSGAQNFSIY